MKLILLFILFIFAMNAEAKPNSNDFLIQLLKKSQNYTYSKTNKNSPLTTKSVQSGEVILENSACSLGGSGCSWDSDCCSNNCHENVCQAGFSCTAGDGACSWDSDCCSKNCTNSVCGHDGGGCTTNGACSWDSDCCSGNCTNGTCGVSCYLDGQSCTYDSECCNSSCNSGRCQDKPSCR